MRQKPAPPGKLGRDNGISEGHAAASEEGAELGCVGGGRFDLGTRFNSAPAGAEAAAHRRPLITSAACLHGVSHTDESVNNSLVLLLISAEAIK